MIKLCVFDMDGLLLDSEKIYLINALKASEIYNYGLSKEFVISTMGLNETTTKAFYLKEYGKSFPFDEFLNNEWELHLNYIKQFGLEKKKGVDELLNYLDKKGIKKAIATSSSQSFAQDYLIKTDLINRFDCIVYGDMLTESKPNPQIYLKVVESFDFNKEEILAFEDSNNGILAAYNAGLKVIHVPDISIVEDSTMHKCYKIIESLDKAINIIDMENR